MNGSTAAMAVAHAMEREAGYRMKIAVVGGGSTYTPELVEGFADRADRLGLTDLVLEDVDGDRLEIVGGLARRILARRGFQGRLTLTTDLEDAVTGASAVLIQLRVGGQATRLRDETIPNTFGLIGQETTGPGGFFKALRTVPVVLDIAETVRRLAQPDAWIVDFTNPTGIVTRALLDAGHRAVGLCNVGIGVQRGIADLFGVAPDSVRLGHAGLNHLTWVRSVMVDGVERIDEMFTDEVKRAFVAGWSGIPIECAQTLRAIPSYYLSYYYATDRHMGEQLAGEHRAQRVLEIEEQLLAMYQDPALDTQPALLTQRGGAHYSTAATALTTSLVTGDGAHHYVNMRNNGTISALPDDATVEVAAVVDRDGPHPLPVPDFAPEIRTLMQTVTAYEELTIEAALSGDERVARRALLTHPLVRQWAKADGAFTAMRDANADLLPQFGCCDG